MSVVVDQRLGRGAIKIYYFTAVNVSVYYRKAVVIRREKRRWVPFYGQAIAEAESWSLFVLDEEKETEMNGFIQPMDCMTTPGTAVDAYKPTSGLSSAKSFVFRLLYGDSVAIERSRVQFPRRRKDASMSVHSWLRLHSIQEGDYSAILICRCQETEVADGSLTRIRTDTCLGSFRNCRLALFDLMWTMDILRFIAIIKE